MSEKVSGENSKSQSVPAVERSSLVNCLTNLVHFTAKAFDSSLESPNTTFLKQSEVARYMWTVALLAPFKDSTVLPINSGRHGERT